MYIFVSFEINHVSHVFGDRYETELHRDNYEYLQNSEVSKDV